MDYNPYHTKEEHYHREKPIPLPPMTTFIVAHIDDSSRKPVSLEKVVDWKEKNPKKGVCVSALCFHPRRQTPYRYTCHLNF